MMREKLSFSRNKLRLKVEIAPFYSPRIARSVFFCFVLFFSGNSAFVLKCNALQLTNQKVSSKNNFHFLVKLSIENS